MNSTKTNGSMEQSFTDSMVHYACVARDDEDEHTLESFFHFLMYGVFLNAVGILGLIGNGISISILSRSNMRSSINCCLVGLASFDAILLTTSLLMFGFDAIPEYTGAMMWYHTDVFPWVTLVAYPLGIIAQTGSVYLTVTVTIERYVAVCHPLKAKSLCTYGRAKIYVISVAIFAILYNITRFMEVTYVHCNINGTDFTTLVSTELRSSDSYIQIYITWLYLVVMYLVPFLGLILFNTFIYKQIRNVKDFHLNLRREESVSVYGRKVRLANNERQRLSRLQRKELTLAAMLLVVVIVFFVCNILAFIVSVLELFGKKIAYLTMLNNLLVTVNSSVNFVIYCIFGQKFRRLFLKMFCFGAFSSSTGYRDGVNSSGGMGRQSVYDRSRMNGANTQSIRLSQCNSLNRVVQNQTFQWTKPSSLHPTPSSKMQYSSIPPSDTSVTVLEHQPLTSSDHIASIPEKQETLMVENQESSNSCEETSFLSKTIEEELQCKMDLNGMEKDSISNNES